METKNQRISGGVICFAGEDWWYHNRGHYDMQVMRRFARHTKVLFVNSIVMQQPKLSDGFLVKKIKRKLKSIGNGLRQVEDNFYVYSPLSVPLHQWRVGQMLNQALVRTQIAAAATRLGMSHPMIWVVCPAAYPIASRLTHSKMVYQRTDCFEEFQGISGNTSEIIRIFDQKLKQESQCVVYVSKYLYENESSSCRKSFLSDHGVEYDLFMQAQQVPYIPSDIAEVPHPIIGFFGAIDEHTFDITLASDVARMLPEYSFVYVGHASSEVQPLQSFSNVYMIGQRALSEIPHYGKCFDVAIMPWAKNRWIQACNPVKLKEYLTLGKPIVSVPFAQLSKYNGLVYPAENAEEFCAGIRKALSDNSAESIKIRQQSVQHDSWDQITERLWNLVVSL